MVNLGNYSIEKSDESTLMIEEHEKTFQHHGREEKLMERKNLKMNKEEDEYVKIHRCNCQIGILGTPTHQILTIYFYNSFTFLINSVAFLPLPSI
jgi:hypothetical protein